MTSPRPLIQRAREHGKPVIHGDRATFLWEGETAPLLTCDLTGWDERPRSFKRLGPARPRRGAAQSLWSCSLTVPRDAYVEYAFMDPGQEETFPDPLNPHSTSNGMGSRNNFFYMPEPMPSSFSMRRAGAPGGTPHQVQVTCWLEPTSRARPWPTESPLPSRSATLT